MGIDSYLTVENCALFIDLQLVIVIDSKPREENLVFVRRHSALVKG